MLFVFLGAGAVGGFYGALLSRAGFDVAFIARGAHLDAIRQHGLRVVGALGEFTARTPAEEDATRLAPADVVIVAVKSYDNANALPLLSPVMAPSTTVLTLQNGVDSAGEVAAIVGEARVIAGATYVATAIESPGVIRQTGT